MKVIGRENIPHKTKILYVSNHQSWIDSFGIGVSLIGFWEAIFHPERIPWNAPDIDNFFKHWFWKYLFAFLKNVPISRRAMTPTQLKRLVKVLMDGVLLLFFEGGRGKPGEIGKCKAGIPYIIRSSKELTVVPIFIGGFDKIMPKEKGARLGAIQADQEAYIVIGKPINFSGIDVSEKKNKENDELIGKLIRQSVVDLQNKSEKDLQKS